QTGLPDPGDAHLIDAALSADCDAILTFNLNDLPEEHLATVGLEAWHPDLVLEEFARSRHPALLRVAADLVTRVRRYERVSDIALTISNAGLPRTGGQMLTTSFSSAVDRYDPGARRA
ncbi:MAG: hypothetical protein AB7G37_13785, partial [Solirubrobacteraceae bacterium]